MKTIYWKCCAVAAALGLSLAGTLHAQWTSGSGGAIYYNGGNVGIGTSSPSNPLSVNGDFDFASRLKFDSPTAFGGSSAVFGLNGSPANSRFLFYDYQASMPLLTINSYGSGGGVLIGSSYITSGSTPNAAPANGLAVQGSVGIGTIAPRRPLDTNGEIVAVPRVTLAQDTGTSSTTWHIDNFSNAFRLFWQPNINTGGTVVMYATTSGNVGIGTTDPANTLSVNGTIQAKEVLVNTSWSDYVFAPGYRLEPLKEVAAFVHTYHHLPGIPSENEVKKNGVSVGEMESKLLAKVEELTLEMIAADKRQSNLESQNRALLEQTRRLQQRLSEVEAHEVQ